MRPQGEIKKIDTAMLTEALLGGGISFSLYGHVWTSGHEHCWELGFCYYCMDISIVGRRVFWFNGSTAERR